MTDRYDGMTRAELESDAAKRPTPVDLTGAPNNAERMRRLREADDAGNVADDQRQGEGDQTPDDVRQVDATDVTVSEGDVTAREGDQGAGQGDRLGEDQRARDERDLRDLPGTRAFSDDETTPPGEPGPTSPGEATAQAAAGNEQVAAKMRLGTEKGYFGATTDPTPNENYTVEGVTSGAPTPETDPAALRRVLDHSSRDRVAASFPTAETGEREATAADRRDDEPGEEGPDRR